MHQSDDWERRVNRAGLRVTRQRTVILDAIRAGGHVTLDDIAWRVGQLDASIDRTTIARNLVTFTEVGVVAASLLTDGGTVYAIAGPDRHHHVVCRNCGGQWAIEDEDLATLIQTLDARYGFLLDQPHLVLQGHCQVCRTARPE